MAKERFEIYKDKSGQYRFRLVAPNNQVIAVSEAYTTKQNCIKGIEAVKRYANSAEIKDLTEE
ncbi:MAG: YegP family protein [Thermoproteales archaeon]|nr:YegP family protein [Thermoproteales archaeon]